MGSAAKGGAYTSDFSNYGECVDLYTTGEGVFAAGLNTATSW